MRHLLGTVGLFLTAGALLQAAGAEPPQPNTLPASEAADGWILLFDGATPFGWKIEGDSKIVNGEMILGGDKATTATVTTTFGNFELQLESCQREGTEGTQIILGQGPAKGGLRLVPRSNPMEWHKHELKAEINATGVGATVQHKNTDLTTGLFAGENWTSSTGSGPITLGIEVPAGAKHALRNIKLRPLGLSPLFNGKDLGGWKEVKTARTRSRFAVTDKGELNVKNGPGDLQTEGQWDDFVLQIEVFSNGEHLNSGVFFRCLPGQFWSGYEAQIRNQWKGDDRTQAVDYGTGGIYNRQPARKVVSSDRE
jgi:hypothetical protein